MKATASKPAAKPAAVASKPASKNGDVKPDLLPADLGGGDIHFLKRNDYAKRTAETYAFKYKAEIKKDHVTQILDALDAGQDEMTGDNPEEFVKLFGIVKEDYSAAVQKVEEDKAKAAQEEAEKEAKAKEAKEKEEALFLAIKDKDPNLGDLTNKFDTGNMDRFIAKGDVSDEDLLGALKAGLKMGEFSGWMIGDLVLELEKRGQLNVVKRLSEEAGSAYSNVYNNAKTARAFPPDKRTRGVSFTIYREVGNAKFTDEQKKKAVPALVNEIAEGKHTTQSVREAVKKVQGKTPPEEVLPEDNEKFQFLVIDTNAETEHMIQVTTGFPTELFQNGATVINPKTLKEFAGRTKKVRWTDLEVYTRPVDPKDKAAATNGGAKPAKKK